MMCARGSAQNLKAFKIALPKDRTFRAQFQPHFDTLDTLDTLRQQVSRPTK